MWNAVTLSVTGSLSLCQRAAARPVAALTVRRTVIHYRDFASLTPKGRAKWAGGRPRRLYQLPTTYHPLASPYGGGGTANAVTERVLTLFFWTSAS